MARSRGITKDIWHKGRHIGTLHIFYILTTDRKLALLVYLQAETKDLLIKINNFLEVWRGSFKVGGFAASLFEGFTYKVDKNLSDLTGYKIGTVFGMKSVWNDTLLIKPVRKNGDIYETRLYLILAEHVPDWIDWSRLDELLRTHLEIQAQFGDFPTLAKTATEIGKTIGATIGSFVGSTVRTTTEQVFSPSVLLFILLLVGGYIYIRRAT